MKAMIFLVTALLTFSAHAFKFGECYEIEMVADPTSLVQKAIVCPLSVRSPETNRALEGLAIFYDVLIKDSGKIETIVGAHAAADFIHYVKNGSVIQFLLGESEQFNVVVDSQDPLKGLISFTDMPQVPYHKVTAEEKNRLMNILKDDEILIEEITSSQLETVMEKRVLQFDWSTSDLQPQDLLVEMSVTCNHDSRISLLPFDDLNLFCGFEKMNLNFDADGNLTLPKIPAFKKAGGQDLDSYKIEMKVTDKQGKNIFGFAADGSRITAFNNFSSAFRITKIKGAELKLSYKGEDFFKTALPQMPKASLSLDLRPDLKNHESEDFYIYDGYGFLGLGANNADYTADEKKLNKLTKLVSPDAYIVTTRPFENYRFRYYARFTSGGYKPEIEIWNQVYLPLTEDVAQKLPVLDLHPEKK